MTVRRKTIEKPTGHGKLRLGIGKSLPVRYALVVLQTVMLAEEGAETGGIGGEFEIRGTIEVDQAQRRVDLNGKTVRLTTADHRCLEVKVESGDAVSGVWDIAASGPNGLEPC